jgi:hypothetical protein
MCEAPWVRARQTAARGAAGTCPSSLERAPGEDVQPHVVHHRLVQLAEDGVHVRIAQLGSEPLEVGSERDRPDVLARVVGLDGYVVGPRPDVGPAEPRQPLGGRGGRGERPRPGPAGQRGRERLAVADAPGGGLERGDVAGAAALGC